MALQRGAPAQVKRKLINMCLRVPPRSWMPAPRSPAPAPAQLTGESAVRRDTAASPSSDLGLGAVWAQCWEGISDPRQLHGAEVPEDLVVPLWRPAPGREQGRARAERAGQPPARASKQHLASCSAQLRPLWARRRPTSTTQQQKACVSPPSLQCAAQGRSGSPRQWGCPLPEVSPADVRHLGAPHAAGLHEVLGRQHHGFDAAFHLRLVVFHRDGDEQAGSPRQVRAPAPADTAPAQPGSPRTEQSPGARVPPALT